MNIDAKNVMRLSQYCKKWGLQTQNVPNAVPKTRKNCSLHLPVLVPKERIFLPLFRAVSVAAEASPPAEP